MKRVRLTPRFMGANGWMVFGRRGRPGETEVGDRW
jgi:hypothetical protein